MRKLLVLIMAVFLLVVLGSCSLEPYIEWHMVTNFQNGWDNITAGDHDYLQYGLDDFGFVHIRGDVYDSNATETTSTIFTLPYDYRPLYEKYFLVPVDTSGTEDFGTLIIYTDGDVVIDSNSASTIDNVYIGEITFDPN